MKLHKTLSTFFFCTILVSIVVAGCGGSPVVTAQVEQNLEQSFLTSLSELKAQYGFSAVKEIDLTEYAGTSLSDDGVVWQADDGDLQPLVGLSLNDQEGLLLEFSYSQSIDDAGSTLNYVLQSVAGSTDSPQIFLSKDGLVVLKDGQPRGSYLFQNGFGWQTGTRYAMFLSRTQAGGLQVIMWNTQDPAQTALLVAEEDILGNSVVQVHLQLTGAQNLTMHTLWKLVYTLDAQAQILAAVDAAAPAAPALEDYQVEDVVKVDALMCDGQSVGEDGVFYWNEMTNEHCDLSLQMGQALAFDFILANPANDWPRVAILMLDANLEGSDMPVKNLGLTLANDKVFLKLDYEELVNIEYSNGFELDAGITYSAVFVMNEHNQFDIQIWPADDPDLRMSIILDGSNVPHDWLPVEGENWNFGVWIPENQQLTISNLYHFSLKDAAQVKDSEMPIEGNTVEDSESRSQEPAWITTGMIPNLNDFFIDNLIPYENINCRGMDDLLFDTGVVGLPIMTDDFTHECQMNLPQGSGLIFEFSYSGENAAQQDAHLLDFAISNGEGEAQKIIRFNPSSNELILKSGDQFIDSYNMQGQIDWEPGKRYTMIFIPSYIKSVYVWPSENPEQSLLVNIASEEWESYFGEDDPQGTWQLRTWVAADIQLQMQNFYRFEAY